MASCDAKNVQLPISRVRTIMKSSPKIKNISNESIYLVAKATELFIQHLAQESLLGGLDNNELRYKEVAQIVNHDQKLQFLKELIPEKITVKKYKDFFLDITTS